MDHDHSLSSLLTLIVVLGGIGLMVFAVIRYDELFLRPICQRYAEENNLEYINERGFSRRRPAVCVFREYGADGRLARQFDKPVASMQPSFTEILVVWPLRYLLLLAILGPVVWLGRKLAGYED